MKYSKKDIQEGLDYLGIKTNDALYVHSAIQGLGLMKNAPIDEIPANILETLRGQIGIQGALIMPDYRYTFPKTGMEDLRYTDGQMGVLSSCLFKNQQTCSSNHPIFTSIGIGAKASEILRPALPEFHPFSGDSTFARLCEQDGYILFIGVGPKVNTFTVFVEREAGVNYRYDKAFKGKLISRDGALFESDFYHFCFPIEGRRHDYSQAISELTDAGILRKYKIGMGYLQGFRAKKFKEFISSKVNNNIEYLRKYAR